MKKTILIGAILCTSILASAQNSNSNTNGSSNGQGVVHWKLDGNEANDNHFMGTTNERPLIFKSNNIEGLRLTPEGEVELDGLKLNPTDETLGLPRVMVLKEDGTISVIQGGELLKFITLDEVNYPGDFNPCGFDPDAAPTNPNSNYGTYSVNWKTNNGTTLKTATINAHSACGKVNVGINTNTPEYNLHVIGNAKIDELTVEKLSFPGGYNNLIVSASNANDKALRIRDKDGVNQFVVKDNGFVWAREVTVTTLANFPDYVFKPDYNLKPLSEVESYINKNGHLPNIPTAKEVKENGMEIGELTRLQMEKIEELTLYMIEMKKEIEALKLENQTLKASIQSK